MADEKYEKREDAAEVSKPDDTLKYIADTLGAVTKRLDSMDEDRKADRTRMDSMMADRRKDSDEDEKKSDAKKDEDEREEGDPKKVVADKRKDESEDEKVEKKADRRKDTSDEKCEDRKDGDGEEKKMADAIADALSPVQRRIADVEKALPRQLADGDKAAFADAQAKADRVHQAFGDAAPGPLQGETLPDYRRRLANGLKKHSARLKEANLHAIHDDNAFGMIEDQIFADAEEAANSPALVQPGRLRERKRVDGGHTIITYDGHPSAWMDQFSGPQRQAVTEFKL